MTLMSLADASSLYSETKCVFILRGLPGTGKSYLSSLIALKALNQKKTVRYCSDDFHFVGLDGKYQWHQWNQEKMRAASQQTQNKLKEAFLEGVHTVFVDNVHHLVGGYQNYAQMAIWAGYRVCVIEVPCDSLEECWRRSNKCAGEEEQGRGYSYNDVRQLHSAWEQDPNALLVINDSSAGQALRGPARSTQALAPLSRSAGSANKTSPSLRPSQPPSPVRHFIYPSNPSGGFINGRPGGKSVRTLSPHSKPFSPKSFSPDSKPFSPHKFSPDSKPFQHTYSHRVQRGIAV